MKRKPIGMTLVEVLIALAIIAILSAIAIPTYNGYIDRSRRNAALVNARTLSLFLENYYERQCDTGNCTYLAGSYDPGDTNTVFMRDLGWNPTDGAGHKDKFKYVVAACAAGTITNCYKITVRDAASNAILAEQERTPR